MKDLKQALNTQVFLVKINFVTRVDANQGGTLYGPQLGMLMWGLGSYDWLHKMYFYIVCTVYFILCLFVTFIPVLKAQSEHPSFSHCGGEDHHAAGDA